MTVTAVAIARVVGKRNERIYIAGGEIDDDDSGTAENRVGSKRGREKKSA